MPVDIEINKKNCKVAIDGEMTIFVAAEILHAISQPLGKHLEIEFDLSQVTEIDAAGLQLMIFAKKVSSANDSALHFVNHSKPVQDILELTDLTGFFGDPIVLSSKAA